MRCGLAAGFLTGVVPVQKVFAGFASSAVITVVEVLLVVAALSRARVIDSFARRIVYHFRSERAALAVICATGAFLSVFMNNIGALALMFPVTMSVCQRLDLPPARMLMPLSFATLLGGMCSLTGTPANLVVNQWLVSETGRGMGYFELALLGGPLTVAGLAWIVFASPGTFARFTVSSSAGAMAPASGFSSARCRTEREWARPAAAGKRRLSPRRHLAGGRQRQRARPDRRDRSRRRCPAACNRQPPVLFDYPCARIRGGARAMTIREDRMVQIDVTGKKRLKRA